MRAYLVEIEVDRIDGLTRPYNQIFEVAASATAEGALDLFRHLRTTSPAPFGVRARVTASKPYPDPLGRRGRWEGEWTREDGPSFEYGFLDSPYRENLPPGVLAALDAAKAKGA